MIMVVSSGFEPCDAQKCSEELPSEGRWKEFFGEVKLKAWEDDNADGFVPRGPPDGPLVVFSEATLLFKPGEVGRRGEVVAEGS